MVVDMNVLYTFNMSNNIKKLVVNDTVGGKDIMEKETRKVNDK